MESITSQDYEKQESIMEKMDTRPKANGKALLPVLVFLVLYLLSK